MLSQLGYKLALWFFGLVVFMKVSMSLNAISTVTSWRIRQTGFH
jgi:hypothetical protein